MRTVITICLGLFLTILPSSLHAATMAKVTAMKGVKSKFQEFQVPPGYVVTPKLGPKLNDYLKEFRQIMGIQ